VQLTAYAARAGRELLPGRHRTLHRRRYGVGADASRNGYGPTYPLVGYPFALGSSSSILASASTSIEDLPVWEEVSRRSAWRPPSRGYARRPLVLDGELPLSTSSFGRGSSGSVSRSSVRDARDGVRSQDAGLRRSRKLNL
jgi:hypothetical protein